MESKKDIFYIKKVIAGDKAAFAFLCDKYKSMVFTIALKVTGNREDAEEVAQDVFLSVYHNLSEFRNLSGFSTWIYRIAYNMAISKIRKKKIETAPIDYVDYDIFGEEDADFENIPPAIVKRAINKLDENEFLILSLFYREDLPVKDICKITGLSESNVKIKLFRGRKKLFESLRKILKTEFDDYYEKRNE